MKIEVLHTAGCAGAPEALSAVRKKVAILAPDAEVEAVQLGTVEAESHPGLRGSPSVLVDGVNLEGTSAPPSGTD